MHEEKNRNKTLKIVEVVPEMVEAGDKIGFEFFDWWGLIEKQKIEDFLSNVYSAMASIDKLRHTSD